MVSFSAFWKKINVGILKMCLQILNILNANLLKVFRKMALVKDGMTQTSASHA